MFDRKWPKLKIKSDIIKLMVTSISMAGGSLFISKKTTGSIVGFFFLTITINTIRPQKTKSTVN